MAAFSGGGEAGRMRACRESAEFDLAGTGSQGAAEALMKGAFEAPLELEEMIRVTLVVGAGKAGRQRYDASLQKWVVGGLKAVGYADDRSASCDFASGGSFKVQHDTGRNLFFVHVFPRATPKTIAADAEEADLAATFDRLGVDEVMCAAEMDTFDRLVRTKCGTWLLKKRMADALRQLKDRFEAIQGKLTNREALDAAEAALFDVGSADDADAKVALVVAAMKRHVDEGQVTDAERKLALDQMRDRAKGLAPAAAKQRAALDERIAKLEKRTQLPAAAAIFPPLHDAAMREVHLQIAKLAPLEALSNSGKLLSLNDANKLAGLSTLEDKLTDLAEASRGWFETDLDLADRLKPLKTHLKTHKAKAVQAANAPLKQGPSDGWSTMTSQAKAPKSKRPAAKAAPASSRGGFALLDD